MEVRFTMILIMKLLTITAILGLPFLLYGLYNAVIGLFGLRKHNRFKEQKPVNKFCAVIAARNEASVIGHLIESLKAQNYPIDLFDIYVIPNNCTDQTASVAKENGAKLFCPKKAVHAKGDALEQFFDYIFAYDDQYDAFCVFDADNLVDENFFYAMNNAIVAGEKIAQGYRESKNPNDSWVSGCQSVFYWTQNRFMNLAKYSLGGTATLNGTGFMVTRDVVIKQGFRTHTLTEDIEYTTQSIINGYRVAWVPEAITYDEHPVDFKTSWKQRKRWSTGIIQCYNRYAPALRQNFHETHDWKALDLIIYLAAPLIQVAGAVYAFTSAALLFYAFSITSFSTDYLLLCALNIMVPIAFSFFFTVLVLLLEKHTPVDVAKSTIFSFWFFLFSWLFINIICLVKPIKTWEPIKHTQSINMSQLKVNK